MDITLFTAGDVDLSTEVIQEGVAHQVDLWAQIVIDQSSEIIAHLIEDDVSLQLDTIVKTPVDPMIEDVEILVVIAHLTDPLGAFLNQALRYTFVKIYLETLLSRIRHRSRTFDRSLSPDIHFGLYNLRISDSSD